MDENSLMKLTFLDDPEQELVRISQELGLAKAIQLLETGSTKGLSKEDSVNILEVIQQVESLFSVTVPRDEDNVIDSLSNIAKQYHWSKLLREKALVALFRLIHLKVANSGIPLVATLLHPDTGTPFDETSFTFWFCKQAAITSTTAFQRMSAYRKMLGIGYSLEEAFRLVITKPYLIQDTLNNLAKYDALGRITNVNPAVATSVSQRLGGDNTEEIQKIAAETAANNTPSNQAKLIEAYTPMLRKAVEEVAAHPSPRDAATFVTSDLLGKPGIFYTIEHGGVLVVTIVTKTIDGANDIEETHRIPFIPKTNDGVPVAIIEDLLERLPIRNRREAEGFLRGIDTDIPF